MTQQDFAGSGQMPADPKESELSSDQLIKRIQRLQLYKISPAEAREALQPIHRYCEYLLKKPTPYECLTFYHYRQRLGGELRGPIKNAVRGSLRKLGGDGSGRYHLVGAWIALSSRDPRSPEHTGFVVAAADFPKSGVLGESPCRLFPTSGEGSFTGKLRDLCGKRVADEPEIKADGGADIVEETFDRLPVWARDYRGFLATNRVLKPSKDEVTKYKNGELVGEARDDPDRECRARDFLVKYGVLVLVRGLREDANAPRQVVMYLAAKDNANKGGRRLVRLRDALDSAANSAVEAAKVKVGDNGKGRVVLALVPLKPRPEKGAEADALLGLLLVLPEKLEGGLFVNADTVKKAAWPTDADECVQGWGADENALLSSLSGLGTTVSRNPILLESLDSLERFS